VVALDLTNDLGVPVVGAISWDRKRGLPDFGFGAAPDGRMALRRAMLELAQTAVGNHAERRMPPEGAFQQWRAAVQREDEEFLRPDGVAAIPVGVTPGLMPLIAHLGELGMEVIALDQTRPETGVPVFRVVCPGLRHPWMRLAPGRLYEVPVALGWIPRRNREEDLNPILFEL
jgi:ribosomal protein S12 methylthiotransferase accessory factor